MSYPKFPTCRHNRSPVNTTKVNGKDRCATCEKAAGNHREETVSGRRGPTYHAPLTIQLFPSPRLYTPPPSRIALEVAERVKAAEARTLFQIEKAKRADRNAPALAAARVELDRQKAAQDAARKGGRPKGRRNNEPPPLVVRGAATPTISPKTDPRDLLWISLPHYGGGAG